MKKLKDIDWAQVLAFDSFVLSHSSKSRWKHALFHLRDAWFTKLKFPVLEPTCYLFFRSLDRADYKELFELIAGTVTDKKVVVQDFLARSRFPNWRYFVTFALHLPIIFQIEANSFRGRFFLYLKACPYIAVLGRIRKIEFKKLVLFADMQPMDNLLAQYFSDRVTITMQHGLYVDYADVDTINTINYSNQPSHYFLAWGQDTANLINRYHPDHIVAICGKPNLQEANLDGAGERNRYFSVIFDQNMFHEYNLELLEIAFQVSEHTGLRINLRPHPWNHLEDYPIRQELLLDQPLVCSRFIIGHTTSMIYEMLRIGVAVFKLKTREPALDTPDFLQFETGEDLIALQVRDMDPEEIKKIGRNYIDSCGQESLEKYREFFERLEATT